MPPDHSTILAFDTSAAHCAAVLLRGGKVISQRLEPSSRDQVQRLMPFLEEFLAEMNIGWADLDAVAVCTGPGNFTGTRIGVSSARGLAMGLNIPAIGVSLFEAAALNSAPQSDGNIAVSVALPREQYGFQEFTTARQPLPVAPPVILATTPVEPAALCIENVARYANLILQNNCNIAPPAPLYLRPADAAPAKDKPPVLLHDI